MIDFLEICGANTRIQPLWSIVGTIINAIMIGVPILLIIFGMVDLGKAVIASKEDEVKKATKLLGKRFLYAVGVFAVVWFVTFVFDTVGDMVKDEDDYSYVDNAKENDSWRRCWKCNIRSNPDDSDYNTKICGKKNK